jgi:hypothetical protein
MNFGFNSNTKISGPILQTDKEIGQHNGFAVTRRGIVNQSSNFNSTVIGAASKWLGTQP